VFDVIVSP